jgi:transposase InsO family protein
MSRVGDCWDNAVAESFFATLTTEFVYRRPWPTKHEARTAIHDYIGAFYNPQSSALVHRLPQFDGLRTATRCRSGSIAGLSTESGQLQYAFTTSDSVVMYLHSGRQYPTLSLSSG